MSSSGTCARNVTRSRASFSRSSIGNRCRRVMATHAVASEPLLKVHDYEGLQDADITQLIQRPRIDFSSIIDTVRPKLMLVSSTHGVSSCPAPQPVRTRSPPADLALNIPSFSEVSSRIGFVFCCLVGCMKLTCLSGATLAPSSTRHACCLHVCTRPQGKRRHRLLSSCHFLTDAPAASNSSCRPCWMQSSASTTPTGTSHAMMLP